MRERDDLTQVKVGDRLIQTAPFSKTEPNDVYVTKVGRKLLTIEQYGRPVQFRIESGELNDRNYPYHSHVYTPEFYARKLYREELESRLQDLGLRFQGFSDRKISNEAFEKIIEIVEEDRRDDQE